jgi:hypothetical protein
LAKKLARVDPCTGVVAFAGAGAVGARGVIVDTATAGDGMEDGALLLESSDRSGTTTIEPAATAPKAATVDESTPGIIDPPIAPSVARSPIAPSVEQPLRPAMQEAMAKKRAEFEMRTSIKIPRAIDDTHSYLRV